MRLKHRHSHPQILPQESRKSSNKDVSLGMNGVGVFLLASMSSQIKKTYQWPINGLHTNPFTHKHMPLETCESIVNTQPY